MKTEVTEIGVEKKISSITGLFKFADRYDILLMVLGTIGSIGDGCSTNILLLSASNVMNTLGYGSQDQKNHGVFMPDVEKYCLYFVYTGLAVLGVAFLEGYCWSRTSERQVLRIRYKYLEAILRQDVGFFDSQQATTSDIVLSISKDTTLIQEALSEKVPIFVMNTSVFVSGLIFSAHFSWRLSLVAFPLVLLLIIPGLTYGKYMLHLSRKSRKEYTKANSIVAQTLSSIKTVYSFTAEKTIVEKYAIILEETVKLGVKQGIAKGLAVGSTGLSFAIWAFLAWYGSKLVIDHGDSGGRIYAAGISFVMGGLALGMALPELKHFAEASVAAAHIIERINRTPEINTFDPNGIKLENLQGEVEFQNIKFTYPSRPESIVLDNFSLKIPSGQTIALVGTSGSGKSTAIALLQRFYDVNGGTVKIDGIDIKKFNLKWIRSKMGLVSQEHALIGTSIKENITFGKVDASLDEIYAAAKTANAHNFIRQLPEAYDTKVGERGALLSGGQKQRIAIARAIIKNPIILLLDEATSALDSESEKLVQNALDQASMGRTTMIVAHKLSTIKCADQIAVAENGTIVEIGTHEDLINNRNSHYSKLVRLQRIASTLEPEPSPDTHRLSSMYSRTASTLSLPQTSPYSIISDHNSPKIANKTPSFFRLLSLNSPEWKQALSGIISALLFGSIQPIYAFTIGGMIAAFYLPDHNELQKTVYLYCYIFASLALLSILTNFSQHYSFAYMGEHLTKRIRIQLLDKILTFEPAWFDEEVNSSGALCSRLSNEASLVKTLVADRVSLMVQTSSSIIIAMTMGLIISWKLALVMIAVQPLSILCYYAKKVVLSNVSSVLARAQNQSTQIAVEAVYNHKMVTSFGCESRVLRLFEDAQEEPLKEARKKSWIAGFAMGCSPCLAFMSWGLDFWYGGKLCEAGEISAGDIFKTFFILVSTGRVIAEAGSMTSDLAKGGKAVASIFEVLDRESLIPGYSPGDDSSKKKLQSIKGKVELKRVDFAYPTRPQILVLREFSLEVKAGSSIGIAGMSGCGKSTIIGLIQRFYDVEKGMVRIDGKDIKELDIVWYRGFTGIVSQEPVMFAGSVRDNIAFGKPDADEEEIVKAARDANAHDFISSLDEGYNTDCGERAQLSGGQKQRIAIARAILRNPAILLLDEATSALDAQSERAVKEALDRIMVGRTTIVVAHRLNTIKNLDSIAFLSEGKLAERGTYGQLMSKKGAFFNLATLQTY